MKLYIQQVRQKFVYRKQVGLQLRYVKHIHDANPILLSLSFSLQQQWTQSDGFGHTIIIPTHIAWRNDLVGVKSCSIRNQVFCSFRIHSTFANALQMRSVVCCTCKFSLSFICLVFFLSLFLLCSKITQYGSVCRNRSTSLHLAAKIDRIFCFHMTTLPYLRLKTHSPCVSLSRASNMSSRIPSSTPLST